MSKVTRDTFKEGDRIRFVGWITELRYEPKSLVGRYLWPDYYFPDAHAIVQFDGEPNNMCVGYCHIAPEKSAA